MKPSSNHPDEFEQLLAQLVGDGLTDEQIARLEQYLANNPDARQAYHQQIQIHSLLTFGRLQISPPGRVLNSPEAFAEYVEKAGAPCVLPPDEEGPDSSWNWITSRGARLVLFSLGALLVGIAGAECWLAWRHPLGERSVAIREEPSVQPVAYLASVNGCGWGNGDFRSQSVGSTIHPDQKVVLYEGIAEFRLASGVSVSVEGPAALSVRSPTSMTIEYGKLSVHVPWTVTDFSVSSKVCCVTASEAEFGMRVAFEDGKDVGDVHAFTREVVAAPCRPRSLDDWRDAVQDEASLPEGSPFSKVVVAQGRSLALTRDGDACRVAEWNRADETSFATKLPMAWPLPISQVYVDAVKKSNPIGYWRFESQADALVTNEVSGESDLCVVGKLRLTRDAINSVADFNRFGSDCFLIGSGPLDALSNSREYTVELWVKPSHIHWGGIVSLLSEPRSAREGHAFYLELQGTPSDFRNPWSQSHAGTIRFLHRDPPSDLRRDGTSCFSANTYGVRRWQHVVAVKSHVDMRLYLNGELSGEWKDESPLGSNLFLLVGRKSSPERGALYAEPISALPFVGQLDELAIYDRALGEQEIQKHYKAVLWDALTTPDRSRERNEPRGRDGAELQRSI